ncbi:hypothetical protein Tco_0883427 [Tanacetum coccineum]
MKRGFRGAPRPLLPAMLLVATTNPSAGQEHPAVAQSQPSSSTIPVPSISSPPPGNGSQTNQADNECIIVRGLKVTKLKRDFQRRHVVYQTLKRQNLSTGRKSQDDPLVSLVQGLVTLLRLLSMASGSNKWKFNKPTTLEQLKLSFKVAELAWISEEVNTGSIKVSTVSEQVSTGSTKRSIPSPNKGQREGKAPMIIEEAPKKSKEQILQEEASLAEAIRLDTLWNGYSRKGQKESQKRPNQARDGKDKVKSKPKSVKVNRKVNPKKV